jgi:hypothetical protein
MVRERRARPSPLKPRRPRDFRAALGYRDDYDVDRIGNLKQTCLKALILTRPEPSTSRPGPVHAQARRQFLIRVSYEDPLICRRSRPRQTCLVALRPPNLLFLPDKANTIAAFARCNCAAEGRTCQDARFRCWTRETRGQRAADAMAEDQQHPDATRAAGRGSGGAARPRRGIQIHRQCPAVADPLVGDGELECARRTAEDRSLADPTRKVPRNPNVLSGEGRLGRIFRSASAPQDRPWMWTITAVVVAPHLLSHGFAATWTRPRRRLPRRGAGGSRSTGKVVPERSSDSQR